MGIEPITVALSKFYYKHCSIFGYNKLVISCKSTDYVIDTDELWQKSFQRHYSLCSEWIDKASSHFT